MGRAAAGGIGPDAALEGGDSPRTAAARAGLGCGNHRGSVSAAGRRRRFALRLRTRRKRGLYDRYVPSHLRKQQHAVVHRPRNGHRMGRSDGRRDGRRPRGDDADRRMAFARDDPAGGGRRGAVRPAPDQPIRSNGPARGRDAAGPRAGRPAVPLVGEFRLAAPQPGDGLGGRQGDHAGQGPGLPGAEPHGQPLQRRHGRSWPATRI